jgi:dTDP-4-dehydrorhamnose 3,5-epimerase
MEWSPQAKQAFQVQSYAPRPAIEGVEIIPLTRHHDDAGSMTELARLVDGTPKALAGFTMRQINFSEIEPGAIKAFHLHTRQTDVWFVPPSDRFLLILVDVRKGSPTEDASMRFMLGAGASRLVRIPPGVAHGVRNLGTAMGRIVYFTDVHFSPEPSDCDEGRLPWDYLGVDVWDMVRG